MHDYTDALTTVLPDPAGSAQAGASAGEGASPRGRRKLHLGHFAFMRAVVQGLDTRQSWARYMRIEGEHGDRRAVRATIAWVRDEFAAAARRERRHGLARLVQVDLTALKDAPSALPTLEAFLDAHPEWRDSSQAEQWEAFEAKHGKPDVRLQRHARLLTKQLDALHWLEALIAQPPLAGDALGAWLNPALAGHLEKAGIVTVAQLIERINGVGFRWMGAIKAIGRAKAERILDWLADHEASIGLAIGSHVGRPRSALAPAELDAVVRPATALRPLEKFRVPADLDGRHGQFRRPRQDCLLDADNDYAAVLVWLRAKTGLTPAQRKAKTERRLGARGAGQPAAASALRSFPAIPAAPGTPDLEWLNALSHTQRAYRKEAERLLLWAILERGKPLSSLTHEDAQAYQAFLADPPPAWCGPRARERWSPLWRPFEKGLSAPAQRQAVVILGSLYRFLVDKNYLIGNPWTDLASPVSSAPRLDARRSFSAAQWLFAERCLAALPESPMTHRLTVALHLLYASGLRISEAVAAKAGDLEWVSFPADEADGQAIDGWLLHVIGKGGRRREVPIPYEITSELSAYFDRRGLDTDLEDAENKAAHLLGKAPFEAAGPTATRRPPRPGLTVRAADGISASTLYDQIKAFFTDCAESLKAQGNERAERRFRQASTHWMRHTHASHAIAGGMPVQVAQQNLGHASLATTTVYVKTETRDRLRKVEAFWGKAEERRRVGG